MIRFKILLMVACLIWSQDLSMASTSILFLTSEAQLKLAGIEVNVEDVARGGSPASVMTINWTPPEPMRNLEGLGIYIDILKVDVPPNIEDQLEGKYTWLSSTRHASKSDEKSSVTVQIPNSGDKDIMVLLGKKGGLMYQFSLNTYLSWRSDHDGEQAGAGRPATAPESKPEAIKKPKPESEPAPK